MKNGSAEPTPAVELYGRAVFIEAEAGQARAAVLDAWLSKARSRGYTTWHVDGSVDARGAWAGLSDLLESLLPAMRQRAPHLIEQHSYELCLVLPALRREIVPRYPSLTDVASDDEKVRNYANDRAYRSIHGLIDLLEEWAAVDGSGALAIACDAFDTASTLVHRFYAELLRRRGRQLHLALLLAVAPGNAAVAQRLFLPELVAAPVRMTLLGSAQVAQPLPSAAECSRLARELEAQIGDDRIEWCLQIPRLVQLWQHSEEPEKALRWLIRAVNAYDHDGLYEIAYRYAVEVEGRLGRIFELDRRLHAAAILNLFFCYAALGHAVRAFNVLHTEGLPKVEDPAALAEIHYFLAMLHARFLPQRDYALATQHLEEALALVTRLPVLEARRYFLKVFMNNGLAYVRHRQGRPDEALELCLTGFDELQQRLAPEEHRLHRSVLLYNAAQVLAALERHEEAIVYLSRATDLDPNYSEYYAERGGLLLKLGRFDDAERDLLRAIELSPPYADVWTNLGQCYRITDRPADAIRAYSRALDLDPNVPVALIGRAEAAVALGDADGAIRDYTAALALEPEQPLVLAGRAVAWYEAGRFDRAVSDLSGAIAAAPEIGELYQNRAVALLALGRRSEALQDLQKYLALDTNADDRADVEGQIAELAAERAERAA